MRLREGVAQQHQYLGAGGLQGVEGWSAEAAAVLGAGELQADESAATVGVLGCCRSSRLRAQ